MMQGTWVAVGSIYGVLGCSRSNPSQIVTLILADPAVPGIRLALRVFSLLPPAIEVRCCKNAVLKGVFAWKERIKSKKTLKFFWTWKWPAFSYWRFIPMMPARLSKSNLHSKQWKRYPAYTTSNSMRDSAIQSFCASGSFDFRDCIRLQCGRWCGAWLGTLLQVVCIQLRYRFYCQRNLYEYLSQYLARPSDIAIFFALKTRSNSALARLAYQSKSSPILSASLQEHYEFSRICIQPNPQTPKITLHTTSSLAI